MSKNEDYLDDLLNSVSGRNDRKDITDLLNTVREGEERTNRERENRRRRRDFGTQFYREFEQELSRPEAGDDDFISSFNLELDAEEASQQMDDFPETIFGKNEKAEEEQLQDEQLIQNINGIVGEAKKRVEGYQEDADDTRESSEAMENFSLGEEEPLLEEEVELSEEEPLPPESEAEGENEQILDETALSSEKDGEGGDDLLSMLSDLSEDSDLSDIGALLKADEEGEEIAPEAGNEFEKLESIDELSGISSAKGGKKKAKKQKKNGAFSHFLNVLFGEDEEETPVKVSEEGSLNTLDDENLAILRELDASNETSGKKDKKKKEKKPKKEKPKKEKKPKAPKPKKEKKPKEPDLSPPLPKKPVILIVVMAASIFLLIMLGSNLTSYSNDISAAKESYRNGKYVEAYTAISGRNVKEADQPLYNKCAVMAMVEEQYLAYLSLMELGKYDMALDSLVRGIGRYDKYYEKAEEYGILLEYNELEVKIEQVLFEQFGVAAEEAKELYQMREREDYSVGIQKILENLGLE